MDIREVRSVYDGDISEKLMDSSYSQFYEDKESGQKRPGKKGVSLAIDEVNTSSRLRS